jgi:hypothetical protein
MSHVPRCSVLVAATIGAGAVIAAVAGTHVAAQQDQTLAPDFRTSLDDSENPSRPNGLRKRGPSSDTRPVGEVPSYGIAPGTGRTGFTSALRRQPKTKGKTKTGVGTPLQLSGTPDLPTAPPPPLAPLPDSSRKAQANARNQPGAPAPAPATPQLVAPPPQLVPTTAPQLVSPDPQLVANPTPPYVLPPLRKKPPPDQDAFEQVGIRFGAFLVKPAIEIGEGYSTNPAAIPGGKGSWFTLIAPELNVQSQWQRHELTATIRGTFTEYDSVSSQDRPFLDAKVNGRIDVTDRTQINLEARYLLSTDYPGSPNLPAGVAKLPPFTDIGTTIGVTHRWNRFEVVAKGTYDRFDYDNADLLDGSIVSQKDRDYNQYGGQLRGSYELTPGIKPFVEGDVDTRVHDLPVDAAGEQRDSHGVSGKVGTTFELSRMLTGDISIGYLTRTYKDPTLQDINALLFDASLVWTATGLTNVKFAASTKVDETILVGVSGILRRDYLLQVDHTFRRWLIGTLKFDYENDDYVGSTRVDKRYTAAAALTYKLNRAWQVKGEVREEWLRANVAGVDYAATIATLGLRWQP